ncbi:STAS domain-containing protein [Bacteroidota bacterium]|nr:STAS domain-containing protein [Bacteroidota bacterium]MBL7127491.1 STAS domain-containing protein [Ignavibacteria bacterium]
MSAKIKVEIKDNGIIVIEPKGNFVGGEETDDLRDTIKNLSEGDNKKLVIDLSDVLYLNSTALGVLISAHANYTKREGKIKLSNLNKNLENLFVITKLALIFDSFENQEEAVASFS